MSHKQVSIVVAGQPKSGTTALAHFLSQHPDVCMSVPKEPGYFATDFREESDAFHGKPVYFKARTEDDYDRHFDHAEKGQRLAEASTCYTYSAVAAKNIKQHNKDAKVIIMLRNPVDFMTSLHMQYVNETVEDVEDFEEALKLEASRKKGKNIPPRTRCPSYHYYKTRAHYYNQVKRYVDTIDKDNLLIVPNEVFKKDNAETYKKIMKFLELDDSFEPEFGTVHGSKAPRSATLNKIAHTTWLKNGLYKVMGPSLYTKTHKKVNKVLLSSKKREDISPELRQKLWDDVKMDVEKTAKLIDQDLIALWAPRQE